MAATRVAQLLRHWGWLVVVVALALALRLPHLSDRSIWYDEASSWQMSRYAWPELWRSVLLNVHQPLYYILLKGWMAVFGDSAAAIRGMSVFFGLITVVLMGLFGRELYLASAARRKGSVGSEEDPEARIFGLFVAMLVALSPVQVFASIEARMYSMGTAFAALGAWLLLRLLRSGGGPGWWAAYGFSLVGLLYSHHYGLFSVAAHVVFVGLCVLWLVGAGETESARRLAVSFGIVGVLAALAYMPALAILRAQSQRVLQDYWIQPLSWTTFATTFSQFVVPDHDDIPRSGGWIVLAVVIGASAILMVDGRRGEWFVMACSLLPMVGSACASAITTVWVGRYFRFAQLFVLAMVALAIWRIARPRPRLLMSAVACLAAGFLVANGSFWGRLDIPHNPGMRGAVASILRQIKPGESIVTTDIIQYTTAKFYVRAKAPIHLLEPPQGLFWGWHLIQPADLISLDELSRKRASGVWLIGTVAVPVIGPDWDWGDQSPVRTGHFSYYLALHRDIYIYHHKSPADDLFRSTVVGPEGD
jgi:mannosyltransferase